MLDAIREIALRWYIFTNSLSVGVMPAFQAVDTRIGIPLITALLLGVLGAAAPCQLSQSFGMLAFLGRRNAGRPRWHAAFAYLAGKAIVYSALGLAAVILGAGLNEVAIPVFVTARKALGPLMIVIGLVLLGVLRWSWAPGAGLAVRLRAIAQDRGDGEPFLLGVAFGLAFCPTLLSLFMGLLIPLALTQPDGVVYPALFALGTAVPLLALLGLLSVGAGAIQQYVRSFARGQRFVSLLAGVFLIVVGLNDTVVYWLL